MQCNVYSCRTLASAGMHLNVNVDIQTGTKFINILYHNRQEFQKWMHLTCRMASMMILPPEVFVVDPLSWYVWLAGPVI